MKKAYITLSIIIMLLSLLAACVNDTGIRPDTSLPQQSQPTPSPTIQPDTSFPQQSRPAASPTKWPVAYSTILGEYKMLAFLIYHDDDYSFFDFIADSDDADEWQKRNFPDLYEIVLYLVIDGEHSGRDELGYALKDLNGDGSDELILLSKGYKVFAVYSTVDGKPKLLDSYWDRYRCYTIDESGLLYIFCFYDSSEDWYYTIQRLSEDGSEFLIVAQYGMESFDYDTNESYPESHYYKVTDGKTYSEREIISKSEFDEFIENHPVFADSEITKSAVDYIPILD